MTQAIQMNIQDLLEIFLRRKWLFVFPFIAIIIGGLLYGLFSPKTYRANTLILVQRQKVPEAYIRPTISAPIGERLRTISQQIMSRTRLEMIIDEFDLYHNLRKSLFLEEVVKIMRENINLQVKGKDSFQLFYQAREPKVVAAVANKLASLFIEENLKAREELSEGTTDFLDRELSRVKKQLEAQEETLLKFKQKYMGALPEQLNANLRSLDRLQLQHQATVDSLEKMRERRTSLQKQISQITKLNSQVTITDEEEGGGDDNEGVFVADNPQLHELRKILANLQARYTEKHPDVIRIKNTIKKQEGEIASGGDRENISDTSSLGYFDDFYQTLEMQLNEIDQEIGKLKKEKKGVEGKIVEYQQRVEDAPKREQEILSIKRDYANTQDNYQSLLSKKLSAQLASNMERMQKGERFKVLDPARVPQKPFKPNRKKILFISLVLGLSLGGGLVFGTEYLDNSFRNINELEKFTELSVMASIPRIITDDDRRRKETKNRIILFSSVGILVVLIVLLIVYFSSSV